LKPKPSTFEFFCQVRSGNSIDIYFFAFHGTFGEDGCIQGLLELADVLYTGSFLSAAIGMNKHQCKTLLCSWDTGSARCANSHEAKTSLSQVRERIHRLDWNSFRCSSPCNLGSSIGISVLMTISLLMQRWSKLSDTIQAEPCVKDILEVTCRYWRTEPIASVVEVPVSTAGTHL